MLPLDPAIESDGPFARACRLGGLENSGVIRRVDVAELIGQIVRDGVTAIRAGGHIVANGHAARRAGFLIVVPLLYWARSEAHGRLPSFARL